MGATMNGDASHAPTLRAVAGGMRALESNDFQEAETSFKAAAVLAAAGRCPGPLALEKCRAYFLASKLLGACQNIAAGMVAGQEQGQFVGGQPQRRHDAAAIEIACLSRHLASLPLDAKHLAVVLRFAAVWNLRVGRTHAAARMLATLAGGGGGGGGGASSSPRTAGAARDALRRCAAAAAAGIGGGGGGGGGGGFNMNGNGMDVADDDERPGAVCAKTLRSLPPLLRRRMCAVCAAAHSPEAAAHVGAACAVCDAPFHDGAGVAAAAAPSSPLW